MTILEMGSDLRCAAPACYQAAIRVFLALGGLIGAFRPLGIRAQNEYTIVLPVRSAERLA